jgi:serine/threonine protein kinase
VTRARTYEPAADLRPGDIVGSYEVQEPLGEGGMARVYRAVGPHGEEVALKFVRSELAREDMFRRRFAREVQTAVRIAHPHVLPVIENGEHEGVPYMAQPFMRGGSLQDRLNAEGALELVTAVTVCLEVAKGVGELHTHGLVHRDLKPANILLDEEGRAFVADFGLAKVPQASLLTQPGEAVGTLHYMAPEQIRAEHVTPSTDVYSLGCIMFEFLAGRPPFAGHRGMGVLWAHLQEKPPDPCAGRDDLPKDLTWAVNRALEKKPEDRPETATGYARMVQVAASVPPLSPPGEP